MKEILNKLRESRTDESIVQRKEVVGMINVMNDYANTIKKYSDGMSKSKSEADIQRMAKEVLPFAEGIVGSIKKVLTMRIRESEEGRVDEAQFASPIHKQVMDLAYKIHGEEGSNPKFWSNYVKVNSILYDVLGSQLVADEDDSHFALVNKMSRAQAQKAIAALKKEFRIRESAGGDFEMEELNESSVKAFEDAYKSAKRLEAQIEKLNRDVAAKKSKDTTGKGWGMIIKAYQKKREPLDKAYYAELNKMGDLLDNLYDELEYAEYSKYRDQLDILWNN